MKPSARTLSVAYLWALVSFLLLDAVWLSLMGPRLYKPALGALMAPEVDWLAAVLFYAIYLAGLLVFAIAPALAEGAPGAALWRGAFFGLVAYATYDLTNQATLRDWPWAITIADLVWGSFVSGVSAWAAARLTSRRANPARAR
jgi:uncharacterized membrane protein